MSYFKGNKLMIKLMNMTMWVVVALTLSGCLSSREFREVKRFDIGQAELNSAPAYEIGDFTIDSRYGEKMFVRTNSNEVSYATYNRWVVRPDKMLKDFVKLATKPGGSAGKVSVNILALEFNKELKKTYFVADYQLKSGDEIKENRVVFSTDTKDFKPSAFADAFRQFALKILTDLQSKESSE